MYIFILFWYNEHMEILIGIIILVFSAILHEVMHGFAADKLGDPTPRLMGRLTLNPIPHIDPLMSILVPTVLILSGSPVVFGAAKPVPINPLYFRDGKKDVALVAFAGPGTNIVIAVLAAFVLKFVGSSEFIYIILLNIVIYNLILAIINLIPIPPLDGSKIMAVFMPNDLARKYLSLESIGIFLLLFLLAFPIPGLNLSGFIDTLLSSALRILGVR